MLMESRALSVGVIAREELFRSSRAMTARASATGTFWICLMMTIIDSVLDISGDSWTF